MNLIKEKEKGNLVVISGPSGTGKGTIIKEVMNKNKNIWYSVSATSRSKRPGEEEGINYYYMSVSDFKSKIEDNYFLEYTEYNGNYYGTPKKNIGDNLNSGKDVILEIEINGALNIKEMIPDAIFVFILPPSLEELKNRLEGRGTETKDKIFDRFKAAYREINEVTKYNYVVVNDNLNEAIEKVDAIFKAERCRVDRIEEIYLNSEEEFMHEFLIDSDSIINGDRNV
jgi:guanylate kinase